MYQRIGFQCFTETLFEDAGKHLFNGELDPRLLVSYYPELRGSLFTADDVMDVFAGVAEHMPQENSVDDISESLSYSLPLLSCYSAPLLVARPRHPLTYLLPFPLSNRAPCCSCLLELIFSCVKPSQELLTSLGTQYAVCTSHSRAEENTGHGCAGDADSIFEEKSNEKERGERFGSPKYW